MANVHRKGRGTGERKGAPSGPEQGSHIAPLIEEVCEHAKKRAKAPLDRLLQLLRDEAQGESDGARDLRREIYSALSWIETAEVQRVLLDALEREPDELASWVGYVLWRQDAIMADLPRRIDEAVAAKDERLAERLLTALVRGDDEGRHRKWVLAHHGALFRRLGLEDE